jgi:hypothetical protein
MDHIELDRACRQSGDNSGNDLGHAVEASLSPAINVPASRTRSRHLAYAVRAK